MSSYNLQFHFNFYLITLINIYLMTRRFQMGLRLFLMTSLLQILTNSPPSDCLLRVKQGSLFPTMSFLSKLLAPNWISIVSFWLEASSAMTWISGTAMISKKDKRLVLSFETFNMLIIIHFTQFSEKIIDFSSKITKTIFHKWLLF